jgi:ribosomal protein S17
LKGKVTKVNNQIMNRNWIHIQDGSSSDKTIDLTVTTNNEVKLGDVVVVKGTITLSKDFGAGYFYDIIMESATVTTEKTM